MKTYAQKIIATMALVVGMTVGSGTMIVSAGPQATNHLERGDSGGPTAIVASVSLDPLRIPQGRYRIGFVND